MSATKNKVAGAYNYVKGKLMRSLGKHTDDRSMQARGWATEGKGAARYGVGKSEDAVNDLKR
jgi:uncharacterized protein YjbJ (UPF0337 family)